MGSGAAPGGRSTRSHSQADESYYPGLFDGSGAPTKLDSKVVAEGASGAARQPAGFPCGIAGGARPEAAPPS